MRLVETGEGSITLRRVVPEDDAFLASVYASTRAEELALTGWSDAQKEQFCTMQFRAQSADYARNHAAAVFSIIERAGAPAGRLYVDRRERAIHIIDIALLPEHRGAGIGTRLLREFQEEARAAGKALSIHVEKFNPALRLYERLGFRAKEETGVYLLMEWRA